MSHYSSLHIVRHHLPDDRLAQLHVDAENKILSYGYHFRHAHPLTVQSWGSVGKALALSNLFTLDEAAANAIARGDPGPSQGNLEVWIERVPGEYMPNGEPLAYRCGMVDAHRPFLEIWTPAHLVSAPLADEMNFEVLPVSCRLLKPVKVFSIPPGVGTLRRL